MAPWGKKSSIPGLWFFVRAAARGKAQGEGWRGVCRAVFSMKKGALGLPKAIRSKRSQLARRHREPRDTRWARNSIWSARIFLFCKMNPSW